jgi:hypothetical protein
MRRLPLACLVAALAATGTADAARHRAPKKPRVAAPKSCTAAVRPAVRKGRSRPRICARFQLGRVTATTRFLPHGSAAPAAPAPSATPVPGTPGVPAPTPTPTPTPSGPVLPTIPTNPWAVQVQAFEFGLQLSKPAVSAGSVRVEFNLARAEDPHNLMLVRADGTGPLYTFDEQPSGAVVAKSFPLTAGRWTLFCSLPEHEASGMRATLTVSG